MPLQELNHFLVLADDLEATRDFYVDVLGLRIGDRPPFNFAGYWIYPGDKPVVHLAGLSGRFNGELSRRPSHNRIIPEVLDPDRCGNRDKGGSRLRRSHACPS